jgi:hypothetical protein
MRIRFVTKYVRLTVIIFTLGFLFMIGLDRSGNDRKALSEIIEDHQDVVKKVAESDRKINEKKTVEKKVVDVRDGPGEMGKPVIIDVSKLSPQEKAKYDAGWKRNQYNQYAADMISLDRSLPDLRFEECKYVKYKAQLPTVSVIIIFHNEALSVLLRTAHSVLNRSDLKLLVEVILVDDASIYGKKLIVYTLLGLFKA